MSLVPTEGSLLASIFPPLMSMICRTMLKPRPVPTEWEFSCENGWKALFARNEGLIPDPVSLIVSVIEEGTEVISEGALTRRET